MPRALLLLLLLGATGCASAPPARLPPVVSFEIKMSWILRLEDQRILRDAPVPMAPPPAIAPWQKTLLPPPPPDLMRLLGDPEARIRRRAALAVGRVGLPEGIPGLVRLLQSDADPEVRQMAAFALGLIGDESAAEPLRQALADPSPIVAGRAADGLGLIGDTASAAAIGRLVAAHVAAAAAIAPDEGRQALDPGVEAFRLGVYALARLKAYEPLAAAVLDPSGQSRVTWWPVAYALQWIEDRRALPALLALASTAGTYTRAFAAKGLGALKDPAAVSVLLPFVDPARSNSTPAIEAMRALGRIGDARASQPLWAVVRARGIAPAVRAEALLALGGLPPDPAIQEYLVDFLSDPAPVIRSAALQAFATGDDDAFMAVLSGLDPDPHWSIRAQLASVLATKDPERALPRLMRMLSDPDGRVIPEVLTALRKSKAPDTAKILIVHLGSEDMGVRAAAASNLGELKSEGAVDALAAAYKRGEADLAHTARAAALDALSQYGAAAMPTLRAALGDKDWAIRVHAAELLKRFDPTVETAQAIRPVPLGRQVSYESAGVANPPVSPHVYIEMDKGTIEIELNVLDAPLTCDSFIALARKGFFNGLAFHHVIPDFAVQGGDPRGDGGGGPGYTIRDELNEQPFLRGVVAMARSRREAGGSQFFITHSPQPQLDARYTVFGRVVSGMDVVDRITEWDVMKSVRVWDGVR